MPQRAKGKDKGQRQEIEDKGEGEGDKVEGKGYLSQKDKALPLDREEMDMALRKWQFMKVNGGKHVLG